jgi:Flp pilus assembly protein TadD
VPFFGLFPNPGKPISSAQAVELSRFALKASPGNAQLWTLQGIAYAGKGDGQEL